MKEEPRSFHKKRKWICPKCGKARMQSPKETDHGGTEKGRSV